MLGAGTRVVIEDLEHEDTGFFKAYTEVEIPPHVFSNVHG